VIRDYDDDNNNNKSLKPEWWDASLVQEEQYWGRGTCSEM
jgi:hypothetical protein